MGAWPWLHAAAAAGPNKWMTERVTQHSHKQTAGGHTNTYINRDTPGLWQKHTARNKASEAEQKQSEKQSKRSSQQARAES